MDFRAALSKAILPAAESHLRPVIKDKAIDTMTDQKKLLDQQLTVYIKKAFEEAQAATNEKLQFLSIVNGIIGNDILDRVFGEDSRDKVFHKIVEFYEQSKPEAGDKAADATMDTLRDMIDGEPGNDSSTCDKSTERSTDRSIFSDFKNEMKSALSDVASGGAHLNEKISHIKDKVLSKCDEVMQKTLEIVKNKIDGETRAFIKVHLNDRSSELMNKLDFDGHNDRGVDEGGFKGFLHKAKEQVQKHAHEMLDNPKDKIHQILDDLQNKIAKEVMEEVQKVLDMIKSNSKVEIEQWFNNKLKF